MMQQQRQQCSPLVTLVFAAALFIATPTTLAIQQNGGGLRASSSSEPSSKEVDLSSSYAATQRSPSTDNPFAPTNNQQSKLKTNERNLSTTSSSKCMESASGISLGCTAQDIKFQKVTGFDILNSPTPLLPCNCTTTQGCDGIYDINCGNYELGTIFGACSGGNNLDTITLQLNVNFEVSTTRYDVGMFINTNGGSALTGATSSSLDVINGNINVGDGCYSTGLNYGTYGSVTIWDVEGDPSKPNPASDNCYDLGSTGLLESYPFNPITISCTDLNNDGLLDFDIGIVWSVKKGDYDCDVDVEDKKPVASSSPKCWYDPNLRATVPIYVPPEPVTDVPTTNNPTSQPTNVPSHQPTSQPTKSPVVPQDEEEEEVPEEPPNATVPPPPQEEEEDEEGCLSTFNLCYALDMSGSVCNNGQNINCNYCTPSYDCQDSGFAQGTCCQNFDNILEFTSSMISTLVSLDSVTEFGSSIVTFATDATVSSELSINSNDTLNALGELVYTGGRTDHGDAILKCQSTFPPSSSSNEGEENKNYIILITDGLATAPSGNAEQYAINAATTAKDQGSIILPVFIDVISNENDITQLEYMKSLSNDGSSVYDISNFDELNGIIGTLTSKVLCDGTYIQAVDDLIETPMNTQVVIDVMTNDVHDGTALISNVDTPSVNGGLVSIDASGSSVMYVPPTNFVGTDTFTYTICYPQDASETTTAVCDTANVTVDVTYPLPVANDDVGTTVMNVPIMIDIIQNDIPSDSDEYPLSISTIGNNDNKGPSHGQVFYSGTINSGSIKYYPNNNYIGTDTFTYTACDTLQQCDEALVSITVLPPPIVAMNDWAGTPHETPIKISVLNNDQSNDELYISNISTLPNNGVAVPQQDGSIIYTPNVGFVGVDTFVYTTCELNSPNVCDDATVSVGVLLAVDDVVGTTRGTFVNVPVLDNDYGTELLVQYFTQPTNGVVLPSTENPLKELMYIPNDDYVGIDTFTYEACYKDQQDVGGTIIACDEGLVTVHVIEAVDDSVTLTDEESVSIAVLTNDSGESLIVNAIPTAPTKGDIAVQDNGSVLYTPDITLFDGSDSFVYQACMVDDDDETILVCDTATVTITGPSTINVMPEANDDSYAIDMYVPNTFNVLINDVDPNGDALIVSEVTTPTHGTASISGNEVAYIPKAGFTGEDTFEYIACDVMNLCDTATVTVIVNPILEDDNVSTQEGDPVTVNVLENYLGTNLVVVSVVSGAYGVCSIASNGWVTYAPTVNGYIGDDVCYYKACTGTTAACGMAKLTINVYAAPTYSPTLSPTESPTESWYYPDFEFESQVCLNDYREPEYMLKLQRDNYLYRSKLECCQTHFWWREQQCMANEHPLYYSNGEICDQKVYFEFHEAKYTPADWSTSDLFDTLDQCCVNKFWWAKEECLANSPQEVTFVFTVDIANLCEPTICQDADIIANALVRVLESEPNSILVHGLRANVTTIGDITLIRNYDNGNPECGGSLSGSNFLGGTDGRTKVEDPTGCVSPITVEVRKKCYESKTEEEFDNLVSFITSIFTDYFGSGDFTNEVQEWAYRRVPMISQLFYAEVVADTFKMIDIINPYAPKEGALYYPDWSVQPNTCVNDGMEDAYMQASPEYYLFETAEDCCAAHFRNSDDCGS